MAVNLNSAYDAFNALPEEQKKAVAQFQCLGCANYLHPEIEGDPESGKVQAPGCYMRERYERGSEVKGCGCANQTPDNVRVGVGAEYPGLPEGFDRLGRYTRLMLADNKTELPAMRVIIFPTQAEQEDGFAYDEQTAVVWKYQQSADTPIFIRGLMPRLNVPFIHVILRGDVGTIKGGILITDALMEKIAGMAQK